MDHTDPDAYCFDEYLSSLGEDWLADDALLRRCIHRCGDSCSNSSSMPPQRAGAMALSS